MLKRNCLSVWRRLHGFGLLVAACCLFVCVAVANAAPVLPDPAALGVDVATTATDMGTALGTIIGTLIGLFGAFLVVRLGLRWIRRTVN